MYNYNIILISINLLNSKKSGFFFSNLVSQNHYLGINIINIFISIFALCFMQRDLIFNILCLELMLFSVVLNFLIFSMYLVEPLGQVMAMCLLALVSAESVIGLSLIIILFFLKGNIEFKSLINLK